MKQADKLKTMILIGWRNIWRNRRRSILVMSTAVVGILGVVLMVALMNGLARMWVESAIESGNGHVQIRPAGFAKQRKDNAIFERPEDIERYLRNLQNEKIPGNHYARRFFRLGFLKLGGKTRGVALMGIDVADEKKISKFDDWIVDGAYLHEASEQDKTFGIIPCVIGRANARKFEVEVGETIVISFLDQNSATRSVRARIQGLFESVAEPIDKYTVLLQRRDLSRLYNGGDNALSYVVFLTDRRQQAAPLKSELLKYGRALHADFLTYEELQPGITVLLEFSDSMMVVFYLFMLVGFAIVLLNSVLMSVFERTREIGIIRALGSSGRMVFGMIVFESLFLGLLGCLAGMIIGGVIILILGQTGFSFQAFARGMEYWGGSGTLIYPSLKIKDISNGFLITALVSFLAAIYPAYKAVRMVPVKAIYSR